jgi:hypothetical protein
MRGAARGHVAAAHANDRPELRKFIPLNNNRNNNNNNRRRGRGNNRSQGGGGNQLNRIDSRARGNAPQLLEKYRKLAHDASLNGDRVQAEYYLQFADHYFRVIADTRTQKDDPRGGRRDAERERGEDDYEDDDFDRGQRYTPSRREEAPEATEDAPRAAEAPAQDSPASEGGESEATENPFTRPARAKPRRARRDRPEAAEGAAQGDSADRLDPSALPGAIGVESSAEESDEAASETAPRRAPRGRGRPRARASGGDEELEAVG